MNDNVNIWDSLSFFESPYNCKQYLKNRIENDFYSINIEKLIDIINKAKSNASIIKIPEFLPIEVADIKKLNLNNIISNSIKQAREYYQAAEVVSNNTKPVLLYYGMLSLSSALLDATLKFPKKYRKVHGLSVDDRGYQGKPYEHVRIEPRGFFIRFYLSYVDQKDYETVADEVNNHYFLPPRNLDEMLQYISKKTYFSFKELLYPIPPIHKEYNEFYSEQWYGFAKSKLKNCLDEISSNFLVMFTLSQIARYQPKKWIDILKGEKRGEMFLFNKYLNISAQYYPRLIYRELTSKASKGLDQYV